MAVNFPGEDPVGRRVESGEVVVGVVADLKWSRLDAAVAPEAYWNLLSPTRLNDSALLVRTTGDPLPLVPAIRDAVAAMDPSEPAVDVMTMEQVRADTIAPRRFNLFLLGLFAIVALLLSLLGIYGVIAYTTAERTFEIGIRIALGARPSEVVSMVVGQGMAAVAAGLLIGLTLALALTRVIERLLYDVGATDVPTLAAIATVMMATAFIASLGPALKTALARPGVALRAE